ncbi:Alpha-(1,3)-fucosyltransferase 7 [Branchiostoma belcheri]|nr:Alpha-(1,3)-fucosyltransferase 7 [Branchiostoma belcheri]
MFDFHTVRSISTSSPQSASTGSDDVADAVPFFAVAEGGGANAVQKPSPSAVIPPDLLLSQNDVVLLMYSLVVLGSHGVGKSALITQYAESRFEEEYNPTIEDNFRKVLLRDGSGMVVGGSGMVMGAPGTGRGLVGGSGLVVGGSGMVVGGSGMVVGRSGMVVGGSGMVVGGSGMVVGLSGMVVGGSGTGRGLVGNGRGWVGNGRPVVGGSGMVVGGSGTGRGCVGNARVWIGNGRGRVGNGRGCVGNGRDWVGNGRGWVGNGRGRVGNGRGWVVNGGWRVGNGRGWVGNDRGWVGNGRGRTDEIDGKSCLLDVLDTGSQEEYQSVRDGGLSRGQGSSCWRSTSLVETKRHAFALQMLPFWFLVVVPQEEYRSVRDGGLSRGQGFVLVFSLTQESSLTELVETRDRVLQARPGGQVPMVLVGNKSDLVTSREVSRGRGEGFSDKFNCPYLETSAMLGTNVHEVFRGLVRQIMKTTPGSRDYDCRRDSRDQARGSRIFQSDDQYNKYFAWKTRPPKNLPPSWEERYCEVCTKLLHASPTERKVYTDLDKWWRGEKYELCEPMVYEGPNPNDQVAT